MRTPSAENPRFPGQGQSALGESVPKARSKGVVDGNPVNIPEPASHRLDEAGTQEGSVTPGWKWAVKRVGRLCREVRMTDNLRRDDEIGTSVLMKYVILSCQEKPLRR